MVRSEHVIIAVTFGVTYTSVRGQKSSKFGLVLNSKDHLDLSFNSKNHMVLYIFIFLEK